MTNSFELSKWYADCVTECGDALICYVAALRWRGLHLRYASVLESRAGSTPRTRWSMRPCKVDADESSFRLTAKSFELNGHWTALLPPVKETIIRNDDGEITWDCLQPKSEAEICVNGSTFRGLGYVEHLRMTIAPWRLPISELRWGRFLGSEHAVVWIDWRGPYSKRVAFHNSRRTEVSASDATISFDHGCVAFDGDRRTLRSGPLGTTALRGVPGLRRFFPAMVLAIEETKWLSRAHIHADGAMDAPGWAIYEVVRWP